MTASNFATCPTTGQAHLFHRAFWHEGKLYYKGRVIAQKEVEEVAE
jgi:large subunit ribosomal protein L32